MTYWNEKRDSHLRLGVSSKYKEFPGIKNYINDEGYVGDLLAPSEAVFLGTCDIMSIADSPELHWARRLHSQLHPQSKFVALGTTGSGVPSMVRRLYAYIQNHGAPKNLYMLIPRFDGYEFVNTEGKCYNVSSRFSTPFYCHENDMVNSYDLQTWTQQLYTVRKTNNKNNIRYIVEERFAFIETLCKLHNINLKWSFNLSDMSIRILHQNLDIFENISDFMKNSFVGLAEVKGHNAYDKSMDCNSHTEVYNKFLNPDKWDFNSIVEMTNRNFKFLTYKSPVHDNDKKEEIRLLKTEDEFTFYHYDRTDVEVNKFYIDSITELYNSGYSTIYNPDITDFLGTIICKVGDKIVGGIFYENYEVDRTGCLGVILTHVVPEFRNRGLFKKLHILVDNIVRQFNYKGVVSYQSDKNIDMIRSRKSVGYLPRYTIYYRPLISDNQ